MKIKNIKLLIIFILLITLICVTKNKIEYFSNLENADIMDSKIDKIIEEEEETRMFCKLLRTNNSPKKQLQKVIEYKNKQLRQDLKKQNKKIDEIKKKIINYKLDSNNIEIKKFNDKKTNQIKNKITREKILNDGINLLKKEPSIKLNINNSIKKNQNKK